MSRHSRSWSITTLGDPSSSHRHRRLSFLPTRVMNAYSSEGASLRARVPPERPAAVMIMVSCHIMHGNVKPGKAARVGQRNLRNEVGDSRVAAR